MNFIRKTANPKTGRQQQNRLHYLIFTPIRPRQIRKLGSRSNPQKTQRLNLTNHLFKLHKLSFKPPLIPSTPNGPTAYENNTMENLLSFLLQPHVLTNLNKIPEREDKEPRYPSPFTDIVPNQVLFYVGILYEFFFFFFFFLILFRGFF